MNKIQQAIEVQQSLGSSDILTVVGIIAVFAIAGVWWIRRTEKWGIRNMSEEQLKKWQYERTSTALGDAITDLLEEYVHKGWCSRERAQKWYNDLGKQGLPDLLPRRHFVLKKTIKLRLSLLDWAPVDIPGPKPIQNIGPKAIQFGAALSRIKKPVVKPTVNA